jgi:hypothetical protein
MSSTKIKDVRMKSQNDSKFGDTSLLPEDRKWLDLMLGVEGGNYTEKKELVQLGS